MSNTLSPTVTERLLTACTPDVLAMLIDATGITAINSFTAEFRREIDGCGGYSCPKIPVMFHWQTADGRRGELDTMLKAFPWGRSEAAAYRYLSPLGAPIPRCYGAMQVPPDASPEGWTPGTEIIFLEYLPHIGFDWDHLGDRLAVARTYARLHAIPEDLPGAPQWEVLRQGAGIDVRLERLRHVVETCHNGCLGPELAEVSDALVVLLPDAAGWLTEMAHQADSFPSGLIHKDASPQNTGWREQRNEALLIDLQPMCIGGILGDLLSLLPPHDYSDDDQQVAAAYCAELNALRQTELTPDDVEIGARLAKSLFRVGFLAWALQRSIDGRVDWTDDVEEGKRVYRGWLLGHLRDIELDLRAYGTRKEGSSV